MTDNTGYCVTRESFIELGINPKTASREIREACDRLFNRVITITTEAGTFKTRWVQDIMKYNSDWALANPEFIQEVTGSDPYAEDYILAAIRFSKSVLPFISNLSSNFTQYFLQDIAGVSSGYSIRFYELMMQFKSTGYRKIRLDDLRNMLDLNDKYPLTADLKRRVIDTAIDELNEKSPIKITYKLLKTGRKFTHLELKFKEKNKEKGQLKCPDTIDMFEEPKNNFLKLSNAQLDMFSSKLADLPEIQGMANVGEEMASFKARLRSMLQDPEKQKTLLPYLKKLGFK